MASEIRAKQSLKTRITVKTLAVFLVCIWALAYYGTRVLRQDVQRELGEQQFATVTHMAAGVNAHLQDRLQGLAVTAGRITPALLGNADALQSFLEDRLILLQHFNAGVMVLDRDGKVVADTQPAAARIDVISRNNGVTARSLMEIKWVGVDPVAGQANTMPVLSMTTPIRDARGRAIGALVGVTNLRLPNFLDEITNSRYGRSGDFILVAPESRMIVAATDQRSVLTTLPVDGNDAIVDAFLAGFEGTVVMANPRGVEMLASNKGIPVAGWLVAAVLPTAEAFAPIRKLQQRLVLAALTLTMLAAMLIWGILQHEFWPLHCTARRLAIQSASIQPMLPLPIARPDEIGQLVAGFNHLFDALKKREAQLEGISKGFRDAMQDIPAVAIQGYAADGTAQYWNHAAEKLYGYRADEAIGRNLLELIVPPELRPTVQSTIDQVFASRKPVLAGEISRVRQDGATVEVLSSHVFADVPTHAPEMFCVDIDLTERKRLEDALRQREHYQRAVFDNFPFIVWLKDKRSRYLAVNAAFASTYGFALTEDVVGKTDYDLAPPDLAEKHCADDQAVLVSGVSRQTQELVEVDGQQRWFETYKSPISEDGDVIGVVGFAREITRYKETESALMRAVGEAEKANHAKSRFLAAASHDLRQPLAALSLYVGVLKTQVEPDSAELVDNIRDCVDSLSELLTDLLDVSKLDAGVVAPRLSDFAIDDLLATVASVHAAEADLKGLRLCRRRSRLIVRTDQTLLRRMISNLVNNAIRYTEHGGVLLACRHHHGKRWVEVWDTGVGIAAGETELIFEEFKQLGDNSRNRGSGLGLAIVAKTAKLLGLQIRLRSQPGRGSMFAVELPPGRALVPVIESQQRPATRTLQIGLVDDHTKVLQALALALENAGHVVRTAASARRIIEVLGESAPDIVVSDYRLADGETGFDVITAVRIRFGDELPALLITGDTDPALIRSMADRGIAVQHKPLQIAELLSLIDEVTERRSS